MGSSVGTVCGNAHFFLPLMEFAQFAEEFIIEFEEAGFVDGEEFLFFSRSFFLGVFFMIARLGKGAASFNHVLYTHLIVVYILLILIL